MCTRLYDNSMILKVGHLYRTVSAPQNELRGGKLTQWQVIKQSEQVFGRKYSEEAGENSAESV